MCKKRLKGKYKKCIYVIFIFILSPVVVNARYFEKIDNIRVKAIIAEPIFKVENLQETVKDNINKEALFKEYIFKIKNFDVLQENENSKRICEVDMEYNIQVINEKINFPIKYELYEFGDNKNLLDNNGYTKKIIICKNIEYEQLYRLVVYWDNREGILDNEDYVKIVVNSSQVK